MFYRIRVNNNYKFQYVFNDWRDACAWLGILRRHFPDSKWEIVALQVS
jgi:hypothetical protein